MHISSLSELSNLPDPRSPGRKHEPYPLLRPGREHVNALRGLGADGSYPPEAVAAVRRALQWLAAAQEARKATDHLNCLDEAETALQGADMDFRSLLGGAQ